MDYTTEKKLRPLYEAIDEGQNKAALTQCAKLLKKSPDWPLVKGLKALVLCRTGKEDEAVELCDQVKKTIPTDEPTLQALTMTLKELGRHSVIAELYENAANLQPKNEEFGVHWFMAMVRNNDFKGQQAAAVKLQRLFKQNKYLFWAIMSLALQGQNGNQLSYTLAERMMAKALDEKRLEEVEHLRLYLLILLDQKKSEQALDLLLNSPLGEKSLRDPEVRQIKSELLRENKRWTEVITDSQEALEKENADDWFNWLAYFDAMEALVQQNDDTIIEKAEALIESLKKATLESKQMKRGPFLAQLELNYRLAKIGKKDEKTVLDHIVSYFAQFGSKSCCFEDLQTYIGFLTGDDAKAIPFIDSLKCSIHSANEKSAKIKNIYKNVNIRKIEWFLNLHAVSDKSIDTVNELWAQYQEALPLGEGLEKTEMQYGDEFVILASHLLLDLYIQHKDTGYLIQAVTLLEMALEKSVYNFQIKLILVRLYVLLGVYLRPFEIYRTMEIKQIQFDTMVHYFSDRFTSLGCSSDLKSVFHEALSIYKSNGVETPEMLVKAYQYGTYSKIQEFIEFRRRLDTSLQQTITKIELMRLESIHSSFQAKYAVQFFQERDMMDIKYDDTYIEACSDNRDFKVLLNSNGTDKPRTEEISKATQSTNAGWAQIFSYILNILSIVCETKQTRDLDAIASQFKQVLEKQKDSVTQDEYNLALYVSHLTNALIAIKASPKDPKEATAILNDANAVLKDNFCSFDEFNSKTVSWNTFHRVSIALEVFNYGSVLTEIMHRLLGLNSKDAKKKAADKAKTDPFYESFVNVQTSAKSSLQAIQTVARNGKDLFRIQFQKKLAKEVLDSEHAASCFKTKEAQTKLNNHIKIMVGSWARSVTELSEEIDRRV
ncbi:TPR-like protein, partial [Backusella circina FSU 941]